MNALATQWPRARAVQVRTIIDRLGLCGCGTDAEWTCILALLTEAEAHTKEGFYRDAWFEFGAKVLGSRHWNLLEHGSSCGFSWLTDDGKLLLDFLRTFGVEGHDMNDGSGHPLWTVEYGWEIEPADDAFDAYAEWAAK